MIIIFLRRDSLSSSDPLIDNPRIELNLCRNTGINGGQPASKIPLFYVNDYDNSIPSSYNTGDVPNLIDNTIALRGLFGETNETVVD